MRAPLFSFLLSALLLPAGAQTITETFEGSTAGSGTSPTNWSLITTAGTPTYATSGTNQGSNGSGGSTGLAGEVSSTDLYAPGETDLPGGYLIHSQLFDMNNALSGTFDFQLIAEGTFDDVVFLVGDIGDGLSDSSNGELIGLKLQENGGGVMYQGRGDESRIDTEVTNLSDDTWYTASFSWTPTSGITGDVSFTVNNFSSNIYTLSTTGFTFDTANAQIGFGSVNDTIRFDNVSLTSIPEPSTIGLVSIAIGMVWLLKKRN